MNWHGRIDTPLGGKGHYMNWRDSNQIISWKNRLEQIEDDDHNYDYLVPDIELDELLSAYLNLIIECQSRGIIYG